FYTKLGPVRDLLTAADDRYVVMKGGDSVRLVFDAAPLPALPPGWVRDYVIVLDGWDKDADKNTVAGQTVEPLPFHGMDAARPAPFSGGGRRPLRRSYPGLPRRRVPRALSPRIAEEGRWSRRVPRRGAREPRGVRAALAACAGLALAVACATTAAGPPAAAGLFRDITEESGIDFRIGSGIQSPECVPPAIRRRALCRYDG